MRGESAAPLLSAQLAVVAPMLAGLKHKLANAEGFDRTLPLWRFESAQALVRFVETVTRESTGEGPASQVGTSHRNRRSNTRGKVDLQCLEGNQDFLVSDQA